MGPDTIHLTKQAPQVHYAFGESCFVIAMLSLCCQCHLAN